MGLNGVAPAKPKSQPGGMPPVRKASETHHSSRGGRLYFRRGVGVGGCDTRSPFIGGRSSPGPDLTGHRRKGMVCGENKKSDRL